MTRRFIHIRVLGAGGFGDLVLAKASDTGELVVLKYLRDAHIPENRRTFQREVRILSKKIRGVVSVIAWNLTADRPFYAMPFHEAGTLEQWAGKLAPGQIQAVAADLSSIVESFHDRSIFHGDLKPANLLIGEDHRIRVADPLGNGAGCTVLFSAHKGGTPGYWAPEVRSGSPISGPGDIYSLGATLYHLATGVRPQDGWRLDLLAREQLADSPVRELVIASCHPAARFRPSLRHIRRILAGERFGAIVQSEKDTVARFVGVGVIVGLGLLAVASGRK